MVGQIIAHYSITSKLAVNDNYSSGSATTKNHYGAGRGVIIGSSLFGCSRTLWASPFGGAESLEP